MKKLFLGISIPAAIVAALYYSFRFIRELTEVMASTGLVKPLFSLALAYYLWKTCGLLLDSTRRDAFIKSVPRWALYLCLIGFALSQIGAGGVGRLFIGILFIWIAESIRPTPLSDKPVDPQNNSSNLPPVSLTAEVRVEEDPRKRELRTLHANLVTLYAKKLQNQFRDPSTKSDSEKKTAE